MQRLLLTGMSGTGKSTVIGRLRELGFRAIDMDEPGWSTTDDAGNQQWCEERLRQALSEPHDVLFVSGCAENQVEFYPEFDHIVLLSAPAAVIIDRLASRTNNPYGKRPAELAEVLENLRTVEPLLRRGATLELDGTRPVEEVVAAVVTQVTG